MNPLNSKQLFGLTNQFSNLINLYESKKLPKVLLLSGKKGSGKFTLINHFLNYVFDKVLYNIKEQSISSNSKIYNKILENTFQNILFINHKDNFRSKIEDIRNLKITISKTLINDNPRFIVFDNIEQLSQNCTNALLKIIEEPSERNFFILIDNKQNKLFDTLSSRCMKYNIFLSSEENHNIINSLTTHYSLDLKIDPKKYNLLPGTYLKFNNLCIENEINLEIDYLVMLNKLLFLYKKNKDPDVINFLIFFTENYFYKLCINNIKYIDYFSLKKNEVISKIKNFVTYNLNVNSVINSIQIKINNE